MVFLCLMNHLSQLNIYSEPSESPKNYFSYQKKKKKVMQGHHGISNKDTSHSIKENAKDQGSENPDYKEVWHHKPDRIHPPLMPNISDFEIIPMLFDVLEETAITLLDAIGEIIGRPKNHYRDCVTGGDSLLRLLQYTRPKTDKNPPWAAAHEDIGFLTILTTALGKALHVKSKSGEVFIPELQAGQFIAQIGDTLQYESIAKK